MLTVVRVFLQSDYIKNKNDKQEKIVFADSRTKGFYFLGKLKPLSLGQFALRKTLHLLGKDCYSWEERIGQKHKSTQSVSIALHKVALGFCFAKPMPLALQNRLTFF